MNLFTFAALCKWRTKTYNIAKIDIFLVVEIS